METELKLLLDPAHFPALSRHALLAASPDAPAQTRHLRSLYFDTPDLFLLRHGASLRVREIEGEGAIQTLKAASQSTGGLHSRDEFETPVHGLRPELDALRKLTGDDPHWRALLGKRGLAKRLQPLFSTEIDRTAWTIRLSQGTEIEVALDAGHLHRDDVDEPIGELELELKSGDPGQLFDLALSLQSVAPMQLGNASKAERGYALVDAAIPQAVKATDIVLKKRQPVDEAMCTILRACLAQIEGNVQGAIHERDAEYVHQMRVGLRRLRSALRLFRKLAPCPAPLLAELRWLGGELGAVRNAEVLAQTTLPELVAAFPAREKLAALCEAAQADARQQRQTLAATLSSTRVTQLFLSLAGWLNAARWRDEASAQQARLLASPVKPFADKALRRCAHRFHARAKRLAAQPPEQRHRARIEAKRWRYAMECFASLAPRHEVGPQVKRLAALQEVLGRLNDWQVAQEALDGLQARYPSLCVAAGFAQGCLATRSRHEVHALDKARRGL